MNFNKILKKSMYATNLLSDSQNILVKTSCKYPLVITKHYSAKYTLKNMEAYCGKYSNSACSVAKFTESVKSHKVVSK